MRPGFESWRQHDIWVEFVVGSLRCSERFFSGFSFSSKTNISKFQFDQESGTRRTTIKVDVLPPNRYWFISLWCSMWSVILFTFAIALTLKLSFVYVIKYWTQLFTINLNFLFWRYQVQCNMASAVMICFLWKSLQEKREYDCFPVNHIACKQALRLQRATRGERERAREQRSREERRKRRSLSPSRTLIYPITWGSRATSRDFPKWRACSQAINHSA